ncbi:MAG: hypothetical protein ACOC5G_01480 [Acidobacteriota bacterium]
MRRPDVKKSFVRSGVICVFFLFLALNQWAQVKTNGYFAFDYVNNQIDSGIIKGTFANPIFGFSLSGAITQNSNFICEALFKEGEKVELKQAWVSLGFSNYFAPKLGLYMVPFGKYNESNRPHQTVLINFPLSSQYLYPEDWRDMGFLIEGRVRGFHYSAYVGNGLKEAATLNKGIQFNDNNTSKSLGGKIGLFIDQGFEVSYSHYRGKYDEEEERNLIYHGANIDWQTENFRVLAEYIKTLIENPSDYDQGEAEGYFVQLSFRLGNITPVGSFQRVEYVDRFHGNGYFSPIEPGEGIDLEKKRWTLALVYQVLENVVIKVEYDFNTDIKEETSQNVFLAQLALNF